MGLFPDFGTGLSDSFDDLFGAGSADDLLSLGSSALKLAGSGLGKASDAEGFNGVSNTTITNAQRQASAAREGTISPLGRIEHKVALHYRNEFQAAEPTNAMVLENEWNNRLQRFSDISRMTGVSIK